MIRKLPLLLMAAVLALPLSIAQADDYTDTVALFKNAGDSAKFFNNSYGYAVFPTIGKGGLGVGGAHGKGRVYVGGKYVGDTTMNQISVGFQAGGQAFSQILFFENKAAFDDFAGGDFELDAQASAVAIKASASAGAGSTGARTSTSSSKTGADTESAGYHKGMAVFYSIKGGAMYEAAVAGQKFKYKPVK